MNIYLTVFALSVGITTMLLLSEVFNKINRHFNPYFAKLQDLTKFYTQEKKEKANAQAMFGKQRVKPQEEISRITGIITGVIIGGIFGVLIMWGTPSQPTGFAVGSLIGMGLAIFYRNNKDEMQKIKKIREVAALYESVDLFIRVGYSVYQSLELSMTITTTITPSLEKCLNSWPTKGSVQSLEEFANDVNIPEAAVLASVLMHIEEAGQEHGATLMAEEARHLEELRTTLAEVMIVSKPLYYSIYRVLPLIAIGGIIIGPLLYSLVSTLGQVFGTGVSL